MALPALWARASDVRLGRFLFEKAICYLLLVIYYLLFESVLTRCQRVFRIINNQSLNNQ